MTDTINFHWKRVLQLLKKSSKPVSIALNLTKVDVNILFALRTNEKITKAQLAKYLSYAPNSLTRSLERLIALELVKCVPDPQDRRFIRLSLTRKGKGLSAQYNKQMEKIWARALNGFRKQEIVAFEATLKRIFSNLYEESNESE